MTPAAGARKVPRARQRCPHAVRRGICCENSLVDANKRVVTPDAASDNSANASLTRLQNCGPHQTTDRTERRLRGVEAEPEVLVAVRRVHITGLMPVWVPSGADLHAALAVAQTD